VPPGDVIAFAEEMNAANADWQLIMYGGALHGFTHSGAPQGAIPGIAYDPRADNRSFAAASAFLAEIFNAST
jgi:dienelactone hydrolase